MEMTERLVRDPDPAGCELVVAPIQWLPQAPLPGTKTICCTMYETTRLPWRTVRFLNWCEAVIVPTEWGKAVMRNSGVAKPIYVVPLGVHPDIFTVTPMRMDCCVFGAAGSEKRKQLDLVMRAFAGAFPKADFNDVELRLKVLHGEQIKSTDKRVHVTSRFLYPNELAQWYQGLTAFVNVGMEGWGFMPHQAMSCGRPLIASQYGGITGYFDASVGYPVNFHPTDAPPELESSGKVAVADQGSIEQEMRRVYLDRSEAASKGCRAAERARQFTWARTIVQLGSVLNHVTCPLDATATDAA